MRKALIVAVALACVMCFAMPAYCASNCASAADSDSTPNGDPLHKLGRGICNSITFPLEIPLQISKTNVNAGPLAAFTWGILKGVGMAGLRAVVGVYEVATFPLPFPKCYKPILTDPEFMFEDQNW